MLKRIRATIERWRGYRRDGARLDWLEARNVIVKQEWDAGGSCMHCAGDDLRGLVDLVMKRENERTDNDS